jgi:hypothetical protein
MVCGRGIQWGSYQDYRPGDDTLGYGERWGGGGSQSLLKSMYIRGRRADFQKAAALTSSGWHVGLSHHLSSLHLSLPELLVSPLHTYLDIADG